MNTSNVHFVTNVQVVPARAGWFAIHDLGEGHSPRLQVCEAIIAWRVETNYDEEAGQFYSNVVCIRIHGCSQDRWGCLRPDGTVEKEGSVFSSLAAAEDHLNAASQRATNESMSVWKSAS